MKLVVGNMWDSYLKYDKFCITTNSTITKAGYLVMGRGIALEAKTRFPTLPHAAAERVRSAGKKYGLIVGKKICLFQVKMEWHEKATLELIRFSMEKLKAYAEENKDLKICLNFPGIGNGKLLYDEVLPIIRELPDNVDIFTK